MTDTLIIIPVLVLWVIRTLKMAFFWLYLWQLKEYHIGRFIDHFSTPRGKALVLNPLLFIKVLLGGLLFLDVFIAVLALMAVYALEAERAIRGKVQLPTFTKKVAMLSFSVVGLIVTFVTINLFLAMDLLFMLLLFDVLTPILVTAVVLSLQPFTVMWRKRYLASAKKKRESLENLTVVGVTGSYGKTTTKEFIAHILGERFKVVKTAEHRNSEVGIAGTILSELDHNHEVFICEMGAYSKGGIDLLARMVQPNIAVLTGVNDQHLATFGSKEGLMSAEGGEELVSFMDDESLVVVNGYSERLMKANDTYTEKYSRRYMVSSRDIWAEDIKATREGISFVLCLKSGEKESVSCSVLGAHNIENILLAVSVALEMGMDIKDTVERINSIPVEMNSMTVRKGSSGVNVLDSSYSANPDGVRADLEYLGTWDGKKAIVMPCLIELGEVSKRVHLELGEMTGKVCDVAIVTTQDQFDALKEGAMKSGMNEGSIVCVESSREVLNILKGYGQKDAVLFEGGKDSRIQRESINALTS